MVTRTRRCAACAWSARCRSRDCQRLRLGGAQAVTRKRLDVERRAEGPQALEGLLGSAADDARAEPLRPVQRITEAVAVNRNQVPVDPTARVVDQLLGRAGQSQLPV